MLNDVLFGGVSLNPGSIKSLENLQKTADRGLDIELEGGEVLVLLRVCGCGRGGGGGGVCARGCRLARGGWRDGCHTAGSSAFGAGVRSGR